MFAYRKLKLKRSIFVHLRTSYPITKIKIKIKFTGIFYRFANFNHIN